MDFLKHSKPAKILILGLIEAYRVLQEERGAAVSQDSERDSGDRT